MTETFVCSVEGALVGESRAGVLVHVEELPKDTPEHDIAAVTLSEYNRQLDGEVNLVSAAEDMLAHHASMHPAGDCLWSRRLEAAIRTA